MFEELRLMKIKFNQTEKITKKEQKYRTDPWREENGEGGPRKSARTTERFGPQQRRHISQS